MGFSDTMGNMLHHATLWSSGTIIDLGTLGGSYSWAQGINNAGQVAGTAFTKGDAQVHATVWNGTTATDLGTLGGNYSWAYGINNAAQVVGIARTTGNVEDHATLWNGTTATDLNTFLSNSNVSDGWVLTEATSINDKGWIVGKANNSKTGESHAYLLSTVTAVPEPEAYAMFLAGLGVMGAIARRRKQISLAA